MWAVMDAATPLGSSLCLPLEAGWSDVGSLEALWENRDEISAGNVTCGGGRSARAAATVYPARSEHRLVVGLRPSK